mgnify:CR=1 FL=1
MARITYSKNGKRDFHHLEEQFDNAFETLQTEEKWKFDNNRETLVKYVIACKQGRAKSGRINKRVSKGTLYRIMGILRNLSEDWVKKDYDHTTQEDWDAFYDNLEEDRIKNAEGKNFKPTTKAKIYKTIRKFLKWKFGENKYYPSFCDTWVTTEETPTKGFLVRSEIERMIETATALRIKTALMMLFDGGFRAEEFANLRWEDVKKPEGKSYYRAHVRRETSKTKKERYVSLWLSTDLINSYKNAMIEKAEGLFSESDFMFPISYPALSKTIKRLGKEALRKHITAHTMRHSSATYYASIIKTYQQFCSRYGWALKSGIAQRYFHAISDDEIAEQTKEHEIAMFKTEFEKIKVENMQMKMHLDRLNKVVLALANERKLEIYG